MSLGYSTRVLSCSNSREFMFLDTNFTGGLTNNIITMVNVTNITQYKSPSEEFF